MGNKTRSAPAYFAFGALERLLDMLEREGMPTRIDHAYLAPEMAYSYASVVVGQLRFLGLLDHLGTPTAVLRTLVPKESRRDNMAKLLSRPPYRGVVAAIEQNPSMTRRELGQFFKRQHHYSDATGERAASFFINAAKYAELPLPECIYARSPRSHPDQNPGSTVRQQDMFELFELEERAKFLPRPRLLRQSEDTEEPSNGPSQLASSGLTRVGWSDGGTASVVVMFDPVRVSAVNRAFFFWLIDRISAFEEGTWRPTKRPGGGPKKESSLDTPQPNLFGVNDSSD